MEKTHGEKITSKFKHPTSSIYATNYSPKIPEPPNNLIIQSHETAIYHEPPSNQTVNYLANTCTIQSGPSQKVNSEVITIEIPQDSTLKHHMDFINSEEPLPGPSYAGYVNLSQAPPPPQSDVTPKQETIDFTTILSDLPPFESPNVPIRTPNVITEPQPDNYLVNTSTFPWNNNIWAQNTIHCDFVLLLSQHKTYVKSVFSSLHISSRKVEIVFYTKFRLLRLCGRFFGISGNRRRKRRRRSSLA